MRRRWIVNASPLILLDKADRLGLLCELADELVIPFGVVEEVGVRLEGERLLAELTSSPIVRMEGSISIPREIDSWDLGRGESEVLAQTVLSAGSRAVLDDLEARRCAQALGVGVIGTLGVVLRATRLGLIPSARPIVERLRESGLYLTEDLVERALAHLGE